MDRKLPGFTPRYFRVELEDQGPDGWCVLVTEADQRTVVRGSGTREYRALSWDEAIELVAMTLDGNTPRLGSLGPY